MNYTSLILTGIDEVLLSSHYHPLITPNTTTPPPPVVEIPPDTIGYTKTFWIGLGVSVITNLVQAFALTFQRKSHLLNDTIYPREERKSAWKRPIWLFAFLSFITANMIGSIFSIGYLPIVILAPIGAINLVFNAFAANLVLGDPLSRQSILGTGLIALGALLVGFFGVIPEPNHSLKDLIVLYKNSGFIIYFTILETLIVTVMLMTHYLEYRCNQIESAPVLLHSQKIKLYGYSLVDLKKYIGISYGILSGNVSSQSMLFAKSGIELIILSITSDENQIKYPLTWFLLVMMILTGAMQLFYLNKGLRLCDTMTLIPLSFCAFNVSCLFNGLVYYNQWDRFRWWQLMYVMFGVIVTIFGVLLLSWQQQQNNSVVDNNKSNVTTDEIGTLRLSLSENEAASITTTMTTSSTTTANSLEEDEEEDTYDIKSNLLVKNKKNKKNDIGPIRLVKKNAK